MKHLARSFAFCLFVILGFALPARAQSNAAVQGSVLDSKGGAVAHAKVTLTNVDTGVANTLETTDVGFYRFSELPPGTYSLVVEASGFKKNTTSDVVVRAEGIRGLDVALEIGEVTQSVNVVGSTTEALQTEDATISGTITNAQVERLPEFGRDPYELVRLAPGVMGDGARSGTGNSVGFPNGPGANAGGGSAGPGGSNTAIFQTENQQPISANGQRVTANDYMVDGVSVNSLQWGGAAVVTPSVESVQEITVLTNSFDAADGRSAGAHVKVVTKAGTNAFHGGGFFQYREPGLNAFNKFGGFNAGLGINDPPVRDENAFRQFGGNIGGPVLKDRLFFFYNYEGLHSNDTGSSDQWIETPDFDQLLAADRPGTPVAATVTAKGVTPRVQSVLPTSCMLWVNQGQPCALIGNAVDVGSPGLTYGTYIPSFSGNHDGGGLDDSPDFEFAQLAVPNQTRGNQHNFRADLVMGRNTFSGSAFLTWFHELGADSGAQSRPMADFNSNRFSPSAFLAWTTTISSTMLNEARFNFTRFAFNDIAANPQIDWSIPRTEIQDLPINGQRIIYGAAQGDTSPGVFAQNQFAFRDVLSKVLTRHALKFGVEYNHEQFNDDLLGSRRPDFVFEQPWNFANGTPIFEAIVVDPLTGGANNAARYYRTTDIGVFVQDDFKFRPNLTFNIGLRWEYYKPPTDARNLLGNIKLGEGANALSGAVATNPSQMWNSDYNNFGPRLGFAWSPGFTHSKAVVRGGFGVAFDRFDDIAFDNARNNPPLAANYGICCGTAVGEFGSPFKDGQILYEAGTTNSPLGYAANPALATPIDPATGFTQILAGQGPPDIWSNPVNMPTPYVYLYSLQLQYELGHAWNFSAGYVGSSAHKLLRIKNLKYFFPTANPDVNNIFTPTPDTTSNFNALLTQLEHQFRGGYLINVQYQYSKSLDELSFEGPGSLTNQTFPTNNALEYGPSDFDATHYFRVFALWDLPILRTRTDWVGKTFGGWEINGVFQFHSGFPWTPVASNICPVLGSSCLSPIRPLGFNGGAGDSHGTSGFLPPTPDNFPNASTSYFTLQTTGNAPETPGIGRNSFRGPRFTDVDFSFVKRFGLPTTPFLGEGARIELRANMFNAFNKLNLQPFTFGSASTVVSSCCGSTPFPNSQFGTALGGLAGRVIELEGRFVF